MYNSVCSTLEKKLNSRFSCGQFSSHILLPMVTSCLSINQSTLLVYPIKMGFHIPITIKSNMNNRNLSKSKMILSKMILLEDDLPQAFPIGQVSLRVT